MSKYHEEDQYRKFCLEEFTKPELRQEKEKLQLEISILTERLAQVNTLLYLKNGRAYEIKNITLLEPEPCGMPRLG